MKVYAFYDSLGDFPCRDNYDELIEIWKKSWKYFGWDPVILTLKDVKQHKSYEKLLKICEKRPTVNRRDFENLCYLRWLSMENISGWYCDVDMINYGFEPTSFGDDVVTTNDSPVIHASCFYMPNQKYKQLIDEIVNYNITDEDYFLVNGEKKPHLSDMIIMSKTKIKVDKCLSIFKEYKNQDNWKNGLIIHYTNNCWLHDINDHAKNRVQIIKEDPRLIKFL